MHAKASFYKTSHCQTSPTVVSQSGSIAHFKISHAGENISGTPSANLLLKSLNWDRSSPKKNISAEEEKNNILNHNFDNNTDNYNTNTIAVVAIQEIIMRTAAGFNHG